MAVLPGNALSTMTAPADPFGFLNGPGEMTSLIRGFDWSATTLGPIPAWPQSLRTATSLLLMSPVPMVMLWGEDGRMIYNDAYSGFAGGRHPQLLGSKVREGWNEIAEFNDNVMRVGLAGGVLSYKDQELTLYRKGRPEPVWMDLDYSPVLDESGRPGGVIAIVVETTERVLAEARLRELNATLEQRVEQRTRELRDSEAFARLALSAVGGVGVWIYEVATDSFHCDAAIIRLYGLDPAQCVGGMRREQFLVNVHPDDRARLAAIMASSLTSADDLELEYRLLHPDGSLHWVLSRAHTQFDDQGRPLRCTGVGVEMTQQRVLEEAFRQSQKMEAVGQLTGGIAHDFNNLLTGINGSLELLQTRIAQGRTGEVERYVTAAQGAARRAAALTHRLLAFSRRQTLDPRPTDMNRLVADMEELIRRTVGPAVQIEVVGAVGLWATLVDPNQLENALLNLCINARHAMPDGGRITIETANRRLDARAALARDLNPGQYVSLCVSDTGTGMSPEVIARAFDPFFTTKPLGVGTGLGLSMIYGFIRQSGGQVRIYSEVGQGTTMCLYLPRGHQAPAEAAADAGLDAAELQGSGEVVLVVDDEPTVRMLIAEVLGDFGYASLEAHDGPAGLKLLQSSARVDLLVTDVGLPGGMNGRQVADAARVLRPELKVLFITGYAENAAVGAGHLDPGMEILTKPFAMDDLAQRIRAMVRG